MGYWVKKKRKGKKIEKQPTASSNTSTECHQHQARPVQIDGYHFKNHTPVSSVLVCSLTQRTFFFTPEAHPAWALARVVAALRHSRVYRHVGLHERVPPESQKVRRSMIQPQYPTNLKGPLEAILAIFDRRAFTFLFCLKALGKMKNDTTFCACAVVITLETPKMSKKGTLFVKFNFFY